MATRIDNERKYPNWIEQPNGGHLYWLEVQGRRGWKARYIKVVDVHETTLSFLQEIYNELAELVEVHDKFPTDSGHRRLKAE